MQKKLENKFAITEEMDWLARRFDDMYDASEHPPYKLKKNLKRMVDDLWEEVDQDLKYLLHEVRDAIKSAAVKAGLGKMEWPNYRKHYAEISCNNAIIRKIRIGEFGIGIRGKQTNPAQIKTDGVYLYGWLHPIRGGKDRQQELYKACRQKIGRTISMAGAKDCPLPADEYANYGIIWYHEHLTRKTRLDDVKKDIAQNAERILRFAADVIRRTFPRQA